MAGLDETPRGNRIHIAFFGLRNAGKSTLVNDFTGQSLAIVSDVPGTTTDPVSKAMEILPLGPCLITDTAGLDDEGELGRLRVKKSLDVLATADIAVWVAGANELEKRVGVGEWREKFVEECRRRGVVRLDYHRGDSVDELKKRIASVRLEERVPGLLDGLVKSGDRVLCIVPIDESAPKGRLILPQQQVIRACLDLGASCVVCQPAQVADVLPIGFSLAITDSQAFGEVARLGLPRLTSFSVLFARQKGDLAEYVRGIRAIAGLKDGDTVLVAEGCTHHRQCNDIGSVKIPKAIERLSGRKLDFVFVSGTDFPLGEPGKPFPALVVHCGGCMLTRREMLRRIDLSRTADVPIVNYGLVLAAANGVEIEKIVPRERSEEVSDA